MTKTDTLHGCDSVEMRDLETDLNQGRKWDNRGNREDGKDREEVGKRVQPTKQGSRVTG